MRVLLMVVAALVSRPAAAQMCDRHVGTVISSIGIDALINSLSLIPAVKGEYETTAAFQARIRDARDKISPTYVVSVPLKASSILYDADSQKLKVDANALGANALSPAYFSARSPRGSISDLIDAGGAYNLDIIASHTEVPIGSYAAQNAYGAQATVTRYRRHTKVIFERRGEWQETLFADANPSNAPRAEPTIFEVSAAPATARSLRKQLRGVVVIAPKAPFYASGKVGYQSPKFDAPNAFDHTLEVVVADVQCALLADGAGRVLAAKEAR